MPYDKPPTRKLLLEVETASGPIRGRIHSDVAPPRPFAGWTELGTAIEQLRSLLTEPRPPVPTCRTAAGGG